MTKPKNQQKSKGYDFFGEWKKNFNSLRPTPNPKPGQKKKKNRWVTFLIYGLLFCYSLYGRSVTKNKMLDLERLSASALMYSEPRGDNWIASDWDYKTKTFKILYIEHPFVPMIKTATYSGGVFYNTTIDEAGAMEWYCRTYEKPPKNIDVSWAFPTQIVKPYCHEYIIDKYYIPD